MKHLLLLLLALALLVCSAPSANAATPDRGPAVTVTPIKLDAPLLAQRKTATLCQGWQFSEAVIYSQPNQSGLSRAINYEYCGQCDRSGYATDLVVINWWRSVRSIYFNAAMGCRVFTMQYRWADATPWMTWTSYGPALLNFDPGIQIRIIRFKCCP